MLPSGVPPLSQPSRQPSEAAYGRSGRPREVGAIRRCVLTSDGIAACPHPLVRREHAPGPCHGTAAASGRYTPTDPSHQISPPRHVSVCHEKRHRDHERERLRSVRRNKCYTHCACWGRYTVSFGFQQPNGPSRAHWHTERSDAGARPQSRERGYQRPRVRRRKARLITRTLCLDRRARTVQSLLQVALSNRRIFTHTHPSCLKGGGRLFQRHAVMSRVLQLIHSAPQLSALSPLQPACLWRVDLRCVAVLPP